MPLRVFSEHDDEVLCVDVQPDQHLIACGGKDGAVTVHDMRSRQVVNALRRHAGAVTGVQLLPHNRIVTAGEDRTVRVADLHGEQLFALAASAPDGDYEVWEVPYLPLDPAHVGRTYEAVIRVNSQSGKGGVAYIMEMEHGYVLPRRLQIEFSKTIQHFTDDSGTEISPAAMWDAFSATYLPADAPFVLRSNELTTDAHGVTTITAHLVVHGEPVSVTGTGNGPIAAFVHALSNVNVILDVVDYHEHSLGAGSGATAVAYVETVDAEGTIRWGIGTDPNIIAASLKAVLGAAARATA